MAKKIIYINPDTGVLAVVIPAYNDVSRSAGGNEDDFLTQVANRAVPDGVDYKIIDDSDATTLAFLEERTFRGAWEHDNEGVPIVNMSKARGIQMDKIRLRRNAELVKLDLVSLQAIEAGDTSAQSTIVTNKQT